MKDNESMLDPMSKLSDLIQLAAENDASAKDELYAKVYDNLHAAAHRFMRNQRNNDLQTTDLVNEVVLRFEKNNALSSIANRRAFFSVAIRAMNQILVDHYRRRKKLVDSPDRKTGSLDDAVRLIEEDAGTDFERLQIALETIASDSPRQHAVIMHRFFGGLSIRDTAELLEVSEPTVARDWRLARAKLLRRLKED